MEKVLFHLKFTVTRRRAAIVFIAIQMEEPRPCHIMGRDLARPLIREILREIERTPEEFRRILQEI